MRPGFRSSNTVCHSDDLTSILSISMLCPVVASLIKVEELDRFQRSIRNLVLEIDEELEIMVSKLHISPMTKLRRLKRFIQRHTVDLW